VSASGSSAIVGIDDATVLHDDMDLLQHGVGTYASRSAPFGNSAMNKAAIVVRETPTDADIPTGWYVTGSMSTSARVLQGEVTRERIIEAATRRFSESGPDASFSVIAADVGMTKGALYHHFESKERLVEESYKAAIKRHAERIVEVSAAGTGRDRLLALILETASLYGSGTPFYRLLLRLHSEAHGLRPYLAPIARRVQRRQLAYVAELVGAGQQDGSIRADVDPAAVAQMVNATVQGLLVQQLEPQERQQHVTEEFAALLARLLTPGARG
jgi:AcrR family transcriptional regulator